MTDREIRRLRRDDLLQILIDQQRRIDELTSSLEETQAALEAKRVALDDVGSLAEASLKLNGVFEAAERAAKQYADEVRARADDILSRSQHEADELTGRSRREADELMAKTWAECEAMVAAARQQAGLPPEPFHFAPKAEPAPEPEPEKTAEAAPQKREISFGFVRRRRS